MDHDDVVAAFFPLELADRLEERLAFDVADGAADLNDRDRMAVLIFLISLVKTVLDLVWGMGTDLNGSSAVIAVAFLI